MMKTWIPKCGVLFLVAFTIVKNVPESRAQSSHQDELDRQQYGVSNTVTDDRWYDQGYQVVFENTTRRDTTHYAGQSAEFHCIVRNLGSGTISWIRKRDQHLIAKGNDITTMDDRFSVRHQEGTDDWFLRISSLQQRDNGHYFCSQTDDARNSIAFRLNVMAYKPQTRVHPCEHSSCYPATGNLLIGRSNRLYASSTCGVNGPERFCIVSHLEEKKCFLCDTRPHTEHDSLKNHRIGQIIYKNEPGTREQSWWQSENGRENVTIQLDLEAEFHFTHLIIVFATFRPAAMLIERSYDFGKTWHVYKYFAHKCYEQFPGIPEVGKNITDVVCDHRYSGVEPSKNGEVIFRVLPPHMNIENPYAENVQNMLKMTNLRINFTKLHNLGDTLLDDRLEIQEKYYYAISNMVVRGSCSCYGHASRCLPLDGVINKYDMVHGRCECTHNTKGLNCEECEDFFNDLPWKPALGKQTNACKKCSCNNHATSCHFDQAVYEHSGRVSGGVCDNCQHNTQGQHCEECIAFFYKDPNEDIQTPYVCKPCDCDPAGSVDEAICDSVSDPDNGIVAGTCHCKAHTQGRRCDTCKVGFWNLDPKNPVGCQNCTCNILGTHNNSGCNTLTGECTCKRLVTGKDCNQCMQETFGLSDSQDGCTQCNCDPGGALDNHCDVISGQCRCRTHMTGRTCSTPKQNHFIPDLYTVYEAELPETTICESHTNVNANTQNCSLVIRELPQDRPATWTGPGYRLVSENTDLVTTIGDVPLTMGYNVVLRYASQMPTDWEMATITVIRPEEYDNAGLCANSYPALEQEVPFVLRHNEGSVVALHDVCLEQDKVYKFRVKFLRSRIDRDDSVARILIDSLVLVPRIEVTPILTGRATAENLRQRWTQLGCNQTLYSVPGYEELPECDGLHNTISIYVHGGAFPCECNPTGSMSKQCDDSGGSCQCKKNVVGRQCDKCAPGTYGFSPEGCKACDCNSIGAKDNDCDLITGQCMCLPNKYGRECNECQPGYWNFPDCLQCQCNGHTQTCDALTGHCLHCQDYTSGLGCDRCIEGFYGNPLLGNEIGCRPCRCPDTISSGHTHADQCQLDPRTNDMVCYCREGYYGARCDVCADNYFGNPDRPGGICEQCQCNDNVDMSRAGNCNSRTGQCQQCLYDTEGDHCELCRDGFYGDALRHDCRRCQCDVLGTNGTIQFCDRHTGQCPCLKNVEGERCDRCVQNHWKIASGAGCEACDCDPVGSESEQCNPYDGQCHCKPEFGGRQCNECQANFWGDPNEHCIPCECNPYGSSTQQCNQQTGKCTCNFGNGGHKCDVCDRGFMGRTPYCSKCGECFDNWDLILNSLQEKTTHVIQEAKQIKKLGATGAYTKDFDAMEKKLGTIRQLLDNTTVSMQDIQNVEENVAELRKFLNRSLSNFLESDANLQGVYSRINLAAVGLDDLRNRSDPIKMVAADLKLNATQLQEANIEGALNLTKEAWNRVQSLSINNRDTADMNANAELQCKRTETLLNRSLPEFNELHTANALEIDDYRNQLRNLTGQIPDLNEHMCDKRGDPCDSLCGGAGCKQCGGWSCEKGAVTRAEKALNYVKDTEANIKKQEEKAEEQIRSLSQTKTNASEAFRRTKAAHKNIEGFFNDTLHYLDVSAQMTGNQSEAINNHTASPDDIKLVIAQTMNLQLELDPAAIKTLAKSINSTVASLENVESIISNTKHDLDRVEYLKEQANAAKKRADEVLQSATNVVKELEEADRAQKKAQIAIDQANDDIELARDDLAQIDSETSEADTKATDTASKVKELTQKLGQLQKNFYKNDLDAKDIKSESEQTEESATTVHHMANQLRNRYQQANESLSTRAYTSENVRERAQALLQRASKITVDTTGKLKELNNMASIYQTSDNQLSTLKRYIDELNERIGVYLKAIQHSSDHYRTCTS